MVILHGSTSRVRGDNISFTGARGNGARHHFRVDNGAWKRALALWSGRSPLPLVHKMQESVSWGKRALALPSRATHFTVPPPKIHGNATQNGPWWRACRESTVQSACAAYYVVFLAVALDL